MELLNMLRSRVLAFAGSRMVLVLLGLVLLGAAAVGGAHFLPTPLMVLLGSVGGLIWFLALDAGWVAFVPPDLRRKLDLRGNRPLLQRRIIAGAILGVWFTIIIWLDRSDIVGLTGASLESPLLGALTVVLALVAFRIGSASAIERLTEESAYEDWLARQRRERKGSGRRSLFRRRSQNNSPED